MYNTQKKITVIVIAGLAFLVAVVIGFSIYSSISRSGKTELEVYVAPLKSNIYANDIHLKPGKNYLKPGEYNIKATMDGFHDYEYTTTIDPGQDEPVVIPIQLAPRTEEAQKYVDDHEQEFIKVEDAAGQAASQEGAKFTEKNPIISKLPVDNLLYTIGYRADPSDDTGRSIIIEIDAAPGYRNLAVGKIKELGYNPSDFKYTFREVRNPFHE